MEGAKRKGKQGVLQVQKNTNSNNKENSRPSIQRLERKAQKEKKTDIQQDIQNLIQHSTNLLIDMKKEIEEIRKERKLIRCEFCKLTNDKNQKEQLKLELENYQKKNKELKRRLENCEKRKSKYKVTLIYLTLFHGITWTTLFYFMKIGIEEFSQSQKSPFIVKISLYILFTCFVAPSVIFVILNSWRWYKEANGNLPTLQEINHNVFDPNMKRVAWIKQWCKYYKQEKIRYKLPVCWTIHFLSVAVNLIAYCFTIIGIKSVVDQLPKAEWKNPIVIFFSIVAFVAFAVIDIIFYHAVYNMIWYNIPDPEYKITPKLEFTEPQVEGIEKNTKDESSIK